MSDAPDGLSTVGLIGGAVSLLTLFGGGIRWFFTRQDRREAALERKEAALMAKLEARVLELEARDEKRARENAALRLAFEIVANVVRRDNPGNPELLRAESILKAAFPIDPLVPLDMLDTLKTLP